MDWIEGLNQAIAYIDRHLDGEIDYEEISRITLSPISLFQRFFVLAAGITLTEYIRRRRLTSALNDLRKTDEKIIDLALKYGYETSDAFCVAFKRLYGMTPSQAKTSDIKLRQYERIYFNLTVNYVKSDIDTILLNIDKYRYYEPLFEGVRILLNNLGEDYTPEYIQGISGAAFKIAGGSTCPTSVWDRWTPDFIRYLGYEIKEYPCFDQNGNDITDKMIDAVKKQIDGGKPALVWHALTNVEWDVVCGYDQEAQHFLGRGTHVGQDDEYARKPWDRAKKCALHDVPAFGAIIIGNKVSTLDKTEAEISSLINAVKHARQEATDEKGIRFYTKWAREYEQKDKERDGATAYCYGVYSSVRRAAVKYLQVLAAKHLKATDYFRYAAECFKREADELDKAYSYLSWHDSPWGIDEERNNSLAPILNAAAKQYEKGIEYLEKILMILQEKQEE